MNRKWTYAIVAALLLFVAFILLRQGHDTAGTQAVNSQRNNEELSDQASASAASSAPLGAGQGAEKRLDEAHKEEVRVGMKALFESLKQKGVLREVPPISKQLQNAIDSKDNATIHRAFQDAIYAPASRMSEAIPAIKSYLDSPEPYVRYLAAEALLRVGDQSGIETLLKIVQSDKTMLQGKRDLRLAAATALAAFNVDVATESVRNLYSNTKEGEALDALVALGGQASEANGWPYISSRLAIESYAKVGATKFVPQITNTFEQTNDPSEKNAAAWALARMAVTDPYVNVLSEAARPAIERMEKGSLSYDDSTMALKYLGSIQSPQAVRVLESALESQNPIAVQYATVNLLFNQPGGSQKAEQLIIREFQTSPQMLGTDLAMQIASKSSNPEVKSAAQAFAQRTGSDRWRYWGVERSEWPIENWAYDYAVTLNP